MGQDENRLRLLTAARALLSRGEKKFSIAAVCTEAGVARDVFKEHFGTKSALMTALAEPQPVAAALPEPQPQPERPVVKLVAEAPKPAPEATAAAPDAWLERRLRVFERALHTLETRQEAVVREHALALARIEEKLGSGAPAPAKVAPRLEVVPPVAPVAVDAEPVVTEQAPPKPAAETLEIAPKPIVVVPRTEMADVLQTAREKVRPVEPEAPPPRNTRLRLLTIGALSLVVLFICAGLTFGHGSAQAVVSRGEGEIHRQLAGNATQQLQAQADAGDAQAQAKLALMYVKGDGVAADAQAAARWSASAAKAGQPVAQYLAGALSDDKTRAVQLFARAAEQGNVKAMHNLAIAYAQGTGTPKDLAKAADWFARAAERGYVDSAFDLAVLYERGEGVPQDLKAALKWYAIAAFAGDKPSQERVDFLRGQMNAADVKLAMTAAGSFAPLTRIATANTL